MDGCQFPDSAGGVPGAFLSGLDVALARLGKDAFRRQGEFASPQDGFPLQRAAKAPDAAPEVLEECLLRHRRQDDDVCQIAEDVGNGAVFLRHGRLMVPGLGVIRPEPGGMVGTSAYGQFPREWGFPKRGFGPVCQVAFHSMPAGSVPKTGWHPARSCAGWRRWNAIPGA